MHVLLLDSIVISEKRQRRKFNEEAIKQLAQDIEQNGLIHPIAIRWEKRLGANCPVLVAGERRCRALTLLVSEGKSIRCNNEHIPLGHIPALTLGELSPLEAMEAELSENIVRTDLTWQERAQAQADLHALRQLQNVRQTVRDTASEVLGAPAQGAAITQVSQAITLAAYMNDPDIAKAKTQDEAVKILRKKKEAAHRIELAKTFNASCTPHIIQCGDSRELITSVSANSIDVLLTDPPYGVGADNFGDMSATGHAYADEEQVLTDILAWLPKEASRVCKERAHAYIFCDFRHFNAIAFEFALEGWTPWQRPLIWDKGGGMLPYPGLGPRYTYECILYLNRGKRPVIYDAQPDVLRIPAVLRPRHGAEKPVDLYAELLRRSCSPGNTVLDPFAGTGPILPAANRTNTKAIAFEQSPEHHALMLTRVNDKELGLDPALNI